MKLFTIAILLFTESLLAAEPKPLRGLDMDYGPVLSYSVLKPGSPAKRAEKAKKGEVSTGYPWTPDELIAARGITVKVGPDATICFDADTASYAAGWTGGWLDITHSHLTNEKGSLPPTAKGKLVFCRPDAPGFGSTHVFSDFPPLGIRGQLHPYFRGTYRDGRNVVFVYDVGTTSILDQPGCIAGGPEPIFTRTMRVEKSNDALNIFVCEGHGGPVKASGDATTITISEGDDAVCVGVLHAPQNAKLINNGNSVSFNVPPLTQPAQFTIAIARWRAIDAAKFPTRLLAEANSTDLTTHTHGGPALWNDVIETAGNLGADKDAYTVDTIALPDKNPWHAWIRPTAIDFFKDGRCAICTWNGDVWIASNLSGKLDHVQWKRYASGLYDTLGIKIVDDQVCVLARNGLIKLHDLNGDGEADFYQNFDSSRPVNPAYNSFAMDLVTDSKGDFYYGVAGTQQAFDEPLHNCVIRISKDGSYHETVAYGLRTPNGLGMGPHDQLSVSDNQGNWVPASPIYFVYPGFRFYNFAGDPHRATKEQMADVLKRFPNGERPICWVPYAWDSSAGGQVWAGEKWGPLSGHMLHTSYGKSALFEVMTEQVGGVWQGAVVQFPLHFDSGIQRARVNPADGQVWVCGLHGWQTSGAKDGCLDRIRYTGKPCYLPTGIHVSEKGFTLTFATELDAETAGDVGSYGIEEWVYHTTEAYGSDDYKPSSPTTKGRDAIEVKKAVLSADKKSVTLEVDGMKPVQQYVIKMNLKAGDGGTIKCQVGGTINEVAH